MGTVDGVTSTLLALRLSHRFATELSELALPWQAEETPAPELLALNDAALAKRLDAWRQAQTDKVADAPSDDP